VGTFTSIYASNICTDYYEKRSEALGYFSEIQWNFNIEYWKRFDEEWVRKLQMDGEAGIEAYKEFTGRNNPRGLLAFSERRTLKRMCRLWEVIHAAEQDRTERVTMTMAN
jgi:hypothetical protein